jgi:hypothetical protein
MGRITTVYKVVRERDEVLYSVDVSAYGIDNPFCLVYSPGETVFPPKISPKSKLLAFETYLDAVSFVSWYGLGLSDGRFQIWKAEATQTKPSNYICSKFEEYEHFWKTFDISDRGNFQGEYSWASTGTLYCDDLTLIERMNEQKTA